MATYTTGAGIGLNLLNLGVPSLLQTADTLNLTLADLNYSGSFDVTGAVTVSSTLAVTGAITATAGVDAGGALALGGTNATGVNIGKASAATTIKGTFNVDEAATFDTTLGVTGATTLSSTLGVTGAATLSSTLGVTGNVTVNTDKFVVTAASGNTAIAGTLEVDSTLGVDGNVRVGAAGASNFSVTASNGNTSVGGTLGVTGATTLSSTLGVTGNVTVNTDKFVVTAASGNTAIAGDLTVSGTGASSFAGNLTVSGDLTVSGTTTTLNVATLDVEDNIIVTNAAPSAASRDGGLFVQRHQTDITGDTAAETGTSQAGAATTITLAAGANAADDYYNGWYIKITNDSPAGALNQIRKVTDYVGATKVATVASAWGTNPDATSTYSLFNRPFVGVIYDESADTFLMVASASDPGAGAVTIQDNVNLRVGGLTVDDGATFSSSLAADSLTVGGGYGSTGVTISNAGAISADGAVTLASTLAVTGNSTLTSVDIGGGYGSTGATISSAGAISADGAITFGSTLAVTGNTTLSGTVAFDGASKSHLISGASSTLRLADDVKLILGAADTDAYLMWGTTGQEGFILSAPTINAFGKVAVSSGPSPLSLAANASGINARASTSSATGSVYGIQANIDNSGGTALTSGTIAALSASITTKGGAGESGGYYYGVKVEDISETAGGTPNLYGMEVGLGYDVGLLVKSGGISITGGALNLSGGSGITNAGAISGATTIAMGGALSGATTGAFSSNVTVGGTLAVTGATTLTGGFDSNAASTVSTLTIDGADQSRYLKLTSNDAEPVEVVTSLYVLAGELYYRETGASGTNLVTQITSNGGLNVGDIALTLDDAYSNGSTITTDAGGGALTIAGNQNIVFSTTGAFNQSGGGQVTFAGNVDASSGVDVTGALTQSGGAVTLAANANSTVGVTSANLTLSTTTSGTLAVSSAGALNLTGAGASTWTVTSGGLTVNSTSADVTVQTTTSGAVRLKPAQSSNIDFSVTNNDAYITSSALTIGEDDTVAITAGDVVCFDSNGRFVRGDADAAGRKFVVGIAANTVTSNGTFTGAGQIVKAAAIPGQIVKVNTDLSAATVGDVVYLSATVGAVTTTAPTAAGSVIFRVGYVHTVGVAGSAKVFFQPQFIGQN